MTAALVEPEDKAALKRRQAAERQARKRALDKQAENIKFVRTDASLYLHPDQLSQKAGAPKAQLRRMAIKELVDNALDASDEAQLDELDEDTFTVSDSGLGIKPDEVPNLFSVTRPMTSSKLIRRPTRGMVGNGLRVVAGAAFASGGGLVVESRGVRQELGFDKRSGDTVIEASGASSVTTGTRVTITFGPALPRDLNAMYWGKLAILMKGKAADPMLTHPDWYTDDSFDELVAAAQAGATAQQVASLFGIDLRSHAHAGKIQLAESEDGRRDIDPDGPVSQLALRMLKTLAPRPPRLVPVDEATFPGVHRKVSANVEISGATVPALVQAWVRVAEEREDAGAAVFVNRTPAPGAALNYFRSSSGDDWIYSRSEGGAMRRLGNVAKGRYRLLVTITTPAVSLLSDGKAPDLDPFLPAIAEAVGPAMRKAHKPKARSGLSLKDAAYEAMEAAYLKASAGNTLPANARQIMYAARPLILEATGKPFSDAYFTQTLLPDFTDAYPEIAGNWDVIYDARGNLVEPHTEKSIPLGTLQVRSYVQRKLRRDSALVAMAGGLHPTAGPGDRFGAVLFIEKEGFLPLLQAAKIPERFDIAVMSTKGMGSVAARKLVDDFSAQGLSILVAHDLDAAGLRIFGTLRGSTRRHKRDREPDVRRLGLTLAQARAMDLQDEGQTVKGDLDQLAEYDATPDEIRLLKAGRRIELNAMTADQFVAWLKEELEAHGVRKLVPSAEAIEARARHLIGIDRIRDRVQELERQAREHAATAPLPDDLAARIRMEMEVNPEIPWDVALAHVMEAAR